MLHMVGRCLYCVRIHSKWLQAQTSCSSTNVELAQGRPKYQEETTPQDAPVTWKFSASAGHTIALNPAQDADKITLFMTSFPL